MRTIAIILALCTSCSIQVDEHVWVTPQAEVTPVADDLSQQDAWAAWVAYSVNAWDGKLVARGCQPPFLITDHGQPLRLVSPDKWESGDDGLAGIENGDGIRVRGDSKTPRGFTYSGVLMHELGHAMGMVHIDDLKMWSVMNPVGQGPFIYQIDIDDAAALLGC